ncbi:conserved hypothetical protein [Acidithiobacillus caldus SM-1]|uniref:Helicase-associated domain-containing protein n=1 Tax=Acidithiobacillus caldus (strain SM-1) TaxID=990288 RepID=F9ZMY1_ACICS|nr:MT-A70 family methyltransferase [Acidithiobacillus caldus]AEK57890.1 conserved hypothetical protein [Acidithiobacillus caldus SM-1]
MLRISEKEYIEALCAWYRVHGNWNPPVRVQGVLHPLGQWVNRVRYAHRKGNLKPALREALQSIGYDFGSVKVDSRSMEHSVEPASKEEVTTESVGGTTEKQSVPPVSCSSLSVLIKQGHRFPVIYADPPWRYGNQATRGATDNHYVTMSLDDIVQMPVRDLVTDDAWLFLWVTHNFLFDSQKVLEGWGFQYKSQIIWNKRDPNSMRSSRMGMGNYARMCHEILIIAAKGKPQGFTRRDVRSVVDAPLSRHSAKPDIFRQIIESVTVGLEPRLELFGRRTAPGWTVFGNQVERDLLDVVGFSAG